MLSVGAMRFYRDSWCSYCNAQLRAFQRSPDGLTSVGAKVAALSVDDKATTRDLIAKHGVQFPVGDSADATPSPTRPASSSTPTRYICNRRALWSIPSARSSSAPIPAAPSGGRDGDI